MEERTGKSRVVELHEAASLLDLSADAVRSLTEAGYLTPAVDAGDPRYALGDLKGFVARERGRRVGQRLGRRERRRRPARAAQRARRTLRRHGSACLRHLLCRVSRRVGMDDGRAVPLRRAGPQALRGHPRRHRPGRRGRRRARRRPRGGGARTRRGPGRRSRSSSSSCASRATSSCRRRSRWRRNAAVTGASRSRCCSPGCCRRWTASPTPSPRGTGRRCSAARRRARPATRRSSSTRPTASTRSTSTAASSTPTVRSRSILGHTPRRARPGAALPRCSSRVEPARDPRAAHRRARPSDRNASSSSSSARRRRAAGCSTSAPSPARARRACRVPGRRARRHRRPRPRGGEERVPRR